MSTKNYKRVYVWQLPVRIFHWLNALAIMILIITGFIIADPPAILSRGEAYNQFWMGKVRMVHFISAYILVAVMIMRIYCMFVGNKYAHWKAFNPFSKKGLKEVIHVIKIDLLLIGRDEDINHISVGHNRVAAFSYVVMFFLALVMIFTGFGLYSDMTDWWLPNLFSWVPEFIGGDFKTRTIHHISTWFFILFTIVHVYLALFHDWLEGRAEVSSMISGYKFVRRERFSRDFVSQDPMGKNRKSSEK
ncbi:MAG: Ni/Fe-hydrogenase, b-type cytochrome subunit [Flavobacteriales bacterium]